MHKTQRNQKMKEQRSETRDSLRIFGGNFTSKTPNLRVPGMHNCKTRKDLPYQCHKLHQKKIWSHKSCNALLVFVNTSGLKSDTTTTCCMLPERYLEGRDADRHPHSVPIFVIDNAVSHTVPAFELVKRVCPAPVSLRGVTQQGNQARAFPVRVRTKVPSETCAAVV